MDFAILCLGRFSNIPRIPEFPPNRGPEAFDGKVKHAMDYANMDYGSADDMVKEQRTTVVRFQKYAMDIAMECFAANGSGTTDRTINIVMHKFVDIKNHCIIFMWRS